MKLRNHILILALLPVLLSCSKMDEAHGWFDNTVISPSVILRQGRPATKSEGAACARVAGSDRGLVLREYISSMDGDCPKTKGLEITTSNFVSEYGSFRTMAYAELDGRYTNDFNLDVSKSGNSWVWEGYPAGEGPSWRNSVPMIMWAYAPLSADGRTAPSVDGWERGDCDVLSFDYEVPEDAEDHTDLLVAFNREQRTFTEKNGKFLMDNGQTPKYSVTFRHALAAVKFTLNSDVQEGIDIKSIKISDVSMSGSCSATGSGKNSISFAWSQLGAPEAFFCEPGSGNSVRDGYMHTGTGVLFMIPQTRSNVELEIEFTRTGSNTVLTRRVAIDGGINWEAGKYYHYDLTGELHFPGEIAFGKASLSVNGFMHAPNQLLMENAVPVKGARHVAVVLDGYTYKDNGAATLILTLAPNGVLPSESCSTMAATSPETFEFNLLDTDLPANPSLTGVYNFGLNNSTPETYKSYYLYQANGHDTVKTTSYLVFDVEGLDTFNIACLNTSTNNGAKYTADIRCIMFLDVDLEN